MAAGFNRSFSLPGSTRPKTRPPPPSSSSDKPYHVRSISLPTCRSHPLLSHLLDDIRYLHSWHLRRPPATDSVPWICDGLARLEVLHASLADLLSLPQNHTSLIRRCGPGSESMDRILDDFLRFADVHGSFRSEMSAANELRSEAQAALRRNDAVRLASCVKSMRKTEKQIMKLASSIREVSRLSPPISARFTRRVSDQEAELAGVIREVIGVTVSASAAVFQETAAALSLNSSVLSALSTATTTKTNSWTSLRKLPSLLSGSNVKNTGAGRKEGEEACRRKAAERLEECVGAVEKRSERLFRCLITTRVSLLNILSSH